VIAGLVVSIIIPCRNEEKFISLCLDSIIANDYPHDRLEVLVVDGMSEDRTRDIVHSYARRYPFIRLIDNVRRITPAALNLGVANAKGEVIMRMDAHARLEKDYVFRCVESIEQYGAENVGGIMKTLPQEGGLLGESVVLSLSHRFGVGASLFRGHTDEPKWVDTVFGGCYRREVFDRVGLFNEDLARGQDMEFNLRLKKAGGQTLLVPDIVSYYYARSGMKSFLKHNWSNGVWAILPFAYSEVMPVSWRHLGPLVFVTSLILTAMVGVFSASILWLFLVILGAYTVASLAAASHIAWRERDSRYLILMPLIFGLLHVGYGLGSLWGVVRLLEMPQFWKKLFALEARRGTDPRQKSDRKRSP